MLLRLSRIAILAICGSAAGGNAWSLGFGGVPDTVVFGQPLDLVVPLHLDPGESLPPGCLHAQVTVGARRLPDDAVRVQLERGSDATGRAHVRIRSRLAVQEPVVLVRLSAGCPASAVRQFVALADPPADLAAGGGGSSAAAAPGARPAARVASAPAARLATATAALHRPAPAPALGAARAAGHEPDEPQRLPSAARLVLAEQDGQLVRMAHAAHAAQAAASAAGVRVAVLEQDLLHVQDGAQQERAAAVQLRQALARAAERDRLLWVAAALVLTLGACSAWLVLRLRVLQRERRAWGQGAGTVPAPAAPPAGSGRPAAVARRAQAPAAPGVGGMSSADAARPAEAGSRVDTPPLRSGPDDAPTPAGRIDQLDQRVDELIDVEQQAEFFVLLGEVQAAIDLLQAHLQQRSAASPLPYLKLLEICRGRADREGYERTRGLFDERFGTPAPHWSADLASGRELLDCPAALAALQSAWPAPRAALRALHKLLFHEPGSELLDLPAYRDVLTLHAVARDLSRRDAVDAGNVDLLLPLARGPHSGAAANRSIFDAVGGQPATGPTPARDRYAAPVDLDLDQPAATDGEPAVAPGRVSHTG